MTADIAICIPTFNQGAFVRQAVESALAQTGAACEIWVADDASTDNTAEVMRRFAPDERVRYHRHERNLGIAGNNNWLLRQPGTEFIVRLDSDDLLAPDYARTLSAELRRNSQAGYAHAAVREIDQTGSVRRDRLLGRKPGYEAPGDALRAMSSGYRVAANICMFRRAVLHQLGFYREKMNFAEDWDLAVRIADAGWGNVYCGGPLASYRVWSDAGNVRARRKLDEIEGCRRVFAESLEPAFRRRGWSLAPLARRRQALAAQHALGALAPVYSPEEKASLLTALGALGDGPPLRRRLLLLRLGFAGTLTWKERAILGCKDSLKRLRPTRPPA
jgi:glycosyltransferase involved in cell wall biosynthesis